MATKIFLDTNIIIDFFDSGRKDHASALEIIISSERGIVTAFASESVLNTTVYILRKHYSVIELKIMLNHLLTFVKIIGCTNIIYERSLKLLSNDIEDSVLYQLASENNLDYFVTSDKKDFKKLSSALLPVVTGKELLDLIS